MASMNEKDYYAILGVDKDATTDDIRRAFQKKARKLHPDVNKDPGAEERFKEVSEAYAVLSDDAKRRRYDALRSGSPFAGYASPAGSAGGGYGGYGGSPFGDFPFGWGFPFGGGYGRGRGEPSARSRAYNPRAGADVSVRLDLDGDVAARGVRRGVTYQRYVACDVCSGRGSVETSHSETCPTCGGSGKMRVDLSGIFGFGVMEMECPECEGTGKVVADPCGNCGGSGRVLSASEVVVEIPAGSHDGDEVRIEGMGNAGTNGYAAGDFVCHIGVPSERLTQRQSMGFQVLGFDLPFIVFGAISGNLAAYSVFVVMLLVAGVLLAFRDGIAHERAWWRNALATLANGVATGTFFAILTIAMYSCTSSLGRAGYTGSALTRG